MTIFDRPAFICDFFRRSILNSFDCHLLDLLKRTVHIRGIFDWLDSIWRFLKISYNVFNKYFISETYLIDPISCGFSLKDRFKYLEAKYWIYWQGPESVSEYIYQIHYKKAVFVSSLIIIISGYILNEGWMSVLFLILAIFICIPYWLLLIFMGDNFRHQDKISSVLIKDIFTDKVFQYCYHMSSLC